MSEVPGQAADRFGGYAAAYQPYDTVYDEEDDADDADAEEPGGARAAGPGTEKVNSPRDLEAFPRSVRSSGGPRSGPSPATPSARRSLGADGGTGWAGR